MSTRNAALSWRLSEATLTTRFAVYSFICIGVMTGALWFIVSSYLINSILDREWQATAQMVRADVRQLLSEEDFIAPDRGSLGPKFDALLYHVTLIPEIVRLKVYSPKGVVIWSDDKRLVGQSFADNDGLKAALRGNVVADMSSLSKKENVFEQASFHRLVEVYVPIYAKNGRDIVGVIETYKRADAIYADIRKARVVVLLGAVGGGLLLYLSLFAIVRQAARKISEQQANLLKMQSHLVASQRMAAVGEIAGAVAHGIGNPLSSIRAVAQVAIPDSDTLAPSEQSRKMEGALHSIIQQVDRVQKRMSELLNFARPLDPHPVLVDVNSLLQDVVATLRPRLEQAEVSAHWTLDARLSRCVVDANHLEQAFMGLVTNAVEATPKGGAITIRTRPVGGAGDGRGIGISIEDSGEGIPVENHGRVFEPFFTTKPHGTGVGLPLAKKFIERNGGRIAIASVSTGGTSIEITLPLPPSG